MILPILAVSCLLCITAILMQASESSRQKLSLFLVCQCLFALLMCMYNAVLLGGLYLLILIVVSRPLTQHVRKTTSSAGSNSWNVKQLLVGILPASITWIIFIRVCATEPLAESPGSAPGGTLGASQLYRLFLSDYSVSLAIVSLLLLIAFISIGRGRNTHSPSGDRQE